MHFFIVLRLTRKGNRLFTNACTHRTNRGTRRPRVRTILAKGLRVTIRRRMLIPSTCLEGKEARRRVNRPHRRFMRISSRFNAALLSTTICVIRTFRVSKRANRVVNRAAHGAYPLINEHERRVKARGAFRQDLSTTIRRAKRATQVTFTRRRFRCLIAITTRRLFRYCNLNRVPTTFSLGSGGSFR